MKITKRLLKRLNACNQSIEWGESLKLKSMPDIELIKLLMKHKKYEWANWLIVRVMKKKQYLAYAIYAAKQVIHIYEKEYPNDKRPRLAIEATERYLKNPTRKNKDAVAYAAYEANAAAYEANAAAYAAANEAYAAAYAADAVAYAANAAAYAAYEANAAADAVAYAAYAANAAYMGAEKEKMQIKILKYGIKLLGAK